MGFQTQQHLVFCRQGILWCPGTYTQCLQMRGLHTYLPLQSQLWASGCVQTFIIRWCRPTRATHSLASGPCFTHTSGDGAVIRVLACAPAGSCFPMVVRVPRLRPHFIPGTLMPFFMQKRRKNCIENNQINILTITCSMTNGQGPPVGPHLEFQVTLTFQDL